MNGAPPTGPWRRSGVLIAWATLAVATAGLFIGTRATQRSAGERRDTLDLRAESRPARRLPEGGVRPAVTWRELPGAQRGPNASFTSDLGDLEQAHPTPEVQAGRQERLAATLRHRAERRAFDGAPPTIPHTVDERSTSACLACHGQGLVIADRIAPPMSHAFYTNCTQCHVPMQKPMVETAAAPPFESSFAPLRSQPGERFAPGAPPAMPHTTFMRQTCVSCHGPLGGAGLRTTHLERVSCHQCHAISNALEQHPGGP